SNLGLLPIRSKGALCSAMRVACCRPARRAGYRSLGATRITMVARVGAVGAAISSEARFRQCTSMGWPDDGVRDLGKAAAIAWLATNASAELVVPASCHPSRCRPVQLPDNCCESFG